MTRKQIAKLSREHAAMIRAAFLADVAGIISAIALSLIHI